MKIEISRKFIEDLIDTLIDYDIFYPSEETHKRIVRLQLILDAHDEEVRELHKKENTHHE